MEDYNLLKNWSLRIIGLFSINKFTLFLSDVPTMAIKNLCNRSRQRYRIIPGDIVALIIRKLDSISRRNMKPCMLISLKHLDYISTASYAIKS